KALYVGNRRRDNRAMRSQVFERFGGADIFGCLVVREGHQAKVAALQDARQILILLLAGIVDVRPLWKRPRIDLYYRSTHNELDVWLKLCHPGDQVIVQALVDD